MERPHHFRSQARKRVRYPAQLTTARGVVRECVLVDLSLAGARLEAVDILPVGERVSLSFSSPTRWDPIVVPAIVAWSRPGSFAHIGLTFEFSSSSTVYALFETVAALEYGA
ncbi:MAG TPA: PilZ domain-containing protein [Polyangiaceae bacterium]|nr:PilZ domain-containing protein [Polyangiaceae bacterium]